MRSRSSHHLHSLCSGAHTCYDIVDLHIRRTHLDQSRSRCSQHLRSGAYTLSDRTHLDQHNIVHLRADTTDIVHLRSGAHTLSDRTHLDQRNIVHLRADTTDIVHLKPDIVHLKPDIVHAPVAAYCPPEGRYVAEGVEAVDVEPVPAT